MTYCLLLIVFYFSGLDKDFGLGLVDLFDDSLCGTSVGAEVNLGRGVDSELGGMGVPGQKQ